MTTPSEKNLNALLLYHIVDSCECRYSFLIGERLYSVFYELLTPLILDPFLPPDTVEYEKLLRYCLFIMKLYFDKVRKDEFGFGLGTVTAGGRTRRHEPVARSVPKPTIRHVLELREFVDGQDGCSNRDGVPTVRYEISDFSNRVFTVPQTTAPLSLCQPDLGACGEEPRRGGDVLFKLLQQQLTQTKHVLCKRWFPAKQFYDRHPESFRAVAPTSKVAGEFMAYLSHLGTAAFVLTKGSDGVHAGESTEGRDNLIITNVERAIRHLKQASLDCLKDIVVTASCCEADQFKLSNILKRQVVALRTDEHQGIGSKGAFEYYDDFVSTLLDYYHIPVTV